MPYARKVDGPHKDIRDALRRCGWTVTDTSRLPGFVDLVCARRGRLELVEVKDGSKPPSAQKLTEAQEKLHAELMRAGVLVKTIRSVEDAVRL